MSYEWEPWVNDIGSGSILSHYGIQVEPETFLDAYISEIAVSDIMKISYEYTFLN